MEEISEVNWNNFKAKFNGREQKSFEALCYLLFCSEFEQKQGLFRYKNQTGIETEPIERNGEIIAWQAKFWETKHKYTQRGAKAEHRIHKEKKYGSNQNPLLLKQRILRKQPEGQERSGVQNRN
jgi:hypothetical protein